MRQGSWIVVVLTWPEPRPCAPAEEARASAPARPAAARAKVRRVAPRSGTWVMPPAPVRDPPGSLLRVVAATPTASAATPEGYAAGSRGTLIQLNAAPRPPLIGIKAGRERPAMVGPSRPTG